MAKPIEGPQPAIIFKVKYVTARGVSSGTQYSGFLDYTQRKQATDREHDSTLTPAAKEPARYEKFIDYTARNSATKLETSEQGSTLTPTFNQGKDQLTVAETQQLKAQLDEAQANQATLWQGVLSFSTKFLIDNRIYDQQTEHCDQAKLKTAVRQNIRQLMTQNQLAESGFWWGDIQFDTNHIHVHLGISERQPHRAVSRQADGRLRVHEARHQLGKRSMLAFKSRVMHDVITLGRPEMQTKQLQREKQLGELRASLRQTLKAKVPANDLEKLMAVLPADRRLWRYRSNAQSMVKAQTIAREMVANYLDHDPDYQTFKQTAQQLDQYNAAAFGQKTAGRTAKHKDDELRERLTNALFKACREEPATKATLTVNGLASHYQAADIEVNRERIKWLKHQQRFHPSQEQAAELRTRRIAFGQQNAHALAEKTQANQQALAKMSAVNNTGQVAKQALTARYHQQAQLAALKLTPAWERTDPDEQRYQHLKAYFTSVVNVPVNQLTPPRVAAMTAQLAAENQLAAQCDEQKLTPELRQALSQAYHLPADFTASDWQQQITTTQLLLRKKAQLAQHKAQMPADQVKKAYQDIKNLTQQLKVGYGEPFKAPGERPQTPEGKTPSERSRTRKFKARRGTGIQRAFKKQQRRLGHQLVVKQTQGLQKEVRAAQQAQVADTRAKQQMFSQQAAIEREQEAMERGR